MKAKSRTTTLTTTGLIIFECAAVWIRLIVRVTDVKSCFVFWLLNVPFIFEFYPLDKLNIAIIFLTCRNVGTNSINASTRSRWMMASSSDYLVLITSLWLDRHLRIYYCSERLAGQVHGFFIRSTISVSFNFSWIAMCILSVSRYVYNPI